MRNLRNIARAAVRFENETPLPLTASTWDTATDSLVCAFGPSPSQASIELRRVSAFSPEKSGIPSSTSIAEWDAQCPHPEWECDTILDLHYFADTSIACLILKGGDLVLVRESPMPGEELLEIVGSVDSGIQAARWSPDEELLVLVTGDGNVVFMSREFETVSETAFRVEDRELSKHVNVGWGKKETQFLGKRARALRDPTMPEKVDEGRLSAYDDGCVRITWRGDGEYVAVNSVEEGARRLMRVFSREGGLESVSEPVDSFEGPLSWRPAGNIIAGVKRTEEKSEVIFFERNGLRHGEFDLRLASLTEGEKHAGVKALHWNIDSTVLAVCFDDKVQLWTMGNYHYYLKQEIRLPGQDQKLTNLVWHPEKALRMSIHGQTEVYMLDYAFMVAKGSTCAPDDYGTVAVIDGRTVKLTPLRIANVPPPMAYHEIEVVENVVDVAVDSKKSLVHVLTGHVVSTFDYAAGSKDLDGPKMRSERSLDAQDGVSVQITIHNGQSVILCYDAEKDQSKIVGLSNEDETWSNEFDTGMNDIRSIGTSIDNSILWASAGAGQVFGFDTGPNNNTTPPRLIAHLPKPCQQIEVAIVGDEEIVFGLTSSGSLYANHLLLVSNCTSFLLTPAHLLFTTTHHLLQFVHLTSVSALEVPPNDPSTDERCRSIERGAKLVTVIPSAHSVVLQMPRGNLETIYPRALVLANIRRHIEEGRYKRAFLACRAQRVDMNILHDHNPEKFMRSVALFLDQLRKVEYIDLFLSQIRDEDVTKTMYRETVKKREVVENVIGGASSSPMENLGETGSLVVESKTNRICNALLKELESRRSTNLQNIITANVCKSPPDLEGGLRVVSQLRESEGEDAAEKAAEHICFLADVNQLYDTALGMYDLELTLLIAQQSQKDPKEYIPYLRGLQEMPSLRRQFTIDNDLGRHKRAMASLHEMDVFEEVKTYAAKHELYSTAIELNKYNPDRLNALMRIYAEYLASRNRFVEAGVAYEFLRDYAAAVPMYKQSQRWREALACATLVPLTASELHELASDLAAGLAEAKENIAAATIYLDYLDDVAEAARAFCKGCRFADAIRIVGLKRQPELLTSVVDTGLNDAFTTTTELLADCKAQLNAQIPRLRELREKKSKDPLAFYAGDPSTTEGGADIRDDISLAPTDATTSAGTFMTRYTGHTNGTLNTQTTRRTSKNRRREERKRARGKKGSVYEEEYLINSIARLVDRVNEVGDDVTALVEALLRRGMRELAVNVEGAMGEVVGMLPGVIEEVWRKDDEDGKEGKKEGEEGATGADAVFSEMVEGVGRREKPVIKAFGRLSLIA